MTSISIKRCDQTANCVDRSDEEGCQVVNIQVRNIHVVFKKSLTLWEKNIQMNFSILHFSKLQNSPPLQL